MQIEVEVKGQRIKRINSPGSVADTLNYLTCYFTFDEEGWDNTVKTAYFRNPASGKTYSQILAEDNTCTVPWEALTDRGFVKFSVSGERENYRITTDIESFYNGETVYGGNPSEPPTPDQYDQMIALAEQTKEIAESVRRDADEGKFDGDPGEPGKPGAPGRDGVSPTAKVEQTDDGAVITITDATGTTTAELKNGKEGNPGQNATDEQVRGAVDAYMAEHPVQVDTDDLIKIAIKEEASGAVPIVTTDSAEMGVQDLTMQGWTEQARYEGKNLFDPHNNMNGFYTGTMNGNVSINTTTGWSWELDISKMIPGQYTISITTDINVRFRYYITDETGSIVKLYEDSSANAKYNTSTFDVPDGTKVLYVSIIEVSASDEAKIMLNSGSTALTYEPYTGGAPSPSPDYPQEIVNAGNYEEGTQKWKYEVKLTGANLFDGTQFGQSGKVLHVDSTSGARDITGIDYKPNTAYTISIEGYEIVTPNGNWTANFTVYYTDGTFDQKYTKFLVGNPLVTNKNKTIQRIVLGNPWKVGETITGIMVNEGSTALPYEPYRLPQTVTLTSDRPLTKWDRLEKRDGVWGWVYKSAEVVLDGTENYTAGGEDYVSDFSSNCYTVISNMVSDGRTNAFMNRLSNIDYSWAQRDAIGFSKNLKQLHVRISNSDLGTTGESSASEITDAMKAYMAQQYEDGNPFIALYETAEETFVPLSESEQEQMNALHTYYPTTVLSNDTECEMSIKYIADTKTYIDSKIAAIQAAIINTI